MKKVGYILSSLLMGMFLLAFNINAFSADAVTITSPAGGETWNTGTSYPITWTQSADFTVNIEAWKAGVFYKTIATAVSGLVAGAPNTYSWSIPVDYPTGADYKINLIKTTEAGVTSLSPAPFTITNVTNIVVSAPAVTDVWGVGTTHSIVWTPTGTTGAIDIKLYQSDGTTFVSNILLAAGASPYSWPIPGGTTPGSYTIKIFDHTAGTPIAGLSAVFTVAKITVTAPTGASQWQTGTTNPILWLLSGTTGPYDIKLYQSDGTTFVQNIHLAVAASPSSWELPILPAGSYTIKITDQTGGTPIAGLSSVFAVNALPYVYVVSPNGPTDIWTRGTTYDITWDDNLSSNVKIELYKGVSWVKTISSASSGNVYHWNIPATTALGSDYKIKITNNSNASCNDQSDAGFQIIDNAGTVTAVQMDALDPVGHSYAAGTQHTISWTQTFPENVNVYLYKDAHTYVSTLKTNVYGMSTNWFIPANFTPTGNYKIMVRSKSYNTLPDDATPDGKDVFSSVFTITVAGGGGHVISNIHLDYSGGAKSFEQGTQHTISWTKDDFSENVNILLYHSPIVAEPPVLTIKTNQYGNAANWFVPANLPTGTYLINIMKVGLTPPSDYYSAIITITYPGGGTGTGEITSVTFPGSVQVGTQQTISWVKTFSENVDIDLVTYHTDCAGSTSVVSHIRTDVYGTECNWFVPANTTPSTHYTIKVFKKGHHDITNCSGEGAITSVPLCTPGGVFPLGGEVIPRGSVQDIQWTTGCTENVKIELIYLVGPHTYVLKSSVRSVAGANDAQWYVSNSLQQGVNQYKIRISSVTNPADSIESDPFTIAIFDLFKAYPNPANNAITLSFDDANTGVFDMVMYNRFGEQIIKKTINTEEGMEQSIPTTNLPDGIYYMVLTSGDKRINRSIIVQH